MSSHTFIDHTADVLFEARAENLEDLFKECALAVSETQFDVSTIKPVTTIEIKGENTKIEHLLFDFLDDLLFYKDAEQLLLCAFNVTIKEDNGVYSLVCKASGEKLDYTKHTLRVDVKAITLHLFEVSKTKSGWFARVLVDI